MAIQTFQLGIVFAIGISIISSATATYSTSSAVAKETIPLSMVVDNPPAEVVIARGQSAYIDCVVRNNFDDESVKVRWLHNGTAMADRDSKWRVYPNGTLFIHKVAGRRFNGSLEGDYQCLAKNRDGMIVTTKTRLKIAYMREFTQQPANQTIAESQAILLPCSINSMPKALIQWERDEKPLPQNKRYIPLSTGSLLITSVHSSDLGSYRCKAFNKILKKTKKSEIGTIAFAKGFPHIAPPKILLPLDVNVTAMVRTDVKLFCIVDGWPIPTVQWLNARNEVISNNSVVEIKQISLEQAGEYSCVASNPKGEASKKFMIDVLEAPRISSAPDSEVYPTVKTIRLNCAASGTPSPEIQWYKNGKAFHVNETFGRAYLSSNVLVISYSIPSDSGIYQCFAENKAGNAWAAALVRVNSSSNSPSPPEGLRCQAYNDTSICLEWRPVANATAYSILAHHSDNKFQDYVTNKTNKFVEKLRPNSNYTFSVRTYSERASNEFAYVTCRTGVRGKRNLTVSQTGPTSVQLNWMTVSSDFNPCNGETGTVYKIQWANVNKEGTNVVYMAGFEYIIKDLDSNSKYEFRVTPVNATGSNNDSAITYSTPMLGSSSLSEKVATNSSGSSIPLVPTRLEVSATSKTSVHFSWIDQNMPGTTYTVCYFVVAATLEGNDCKLIPKVADKSIDIEYLLPKTRYEFKVRAHTADDHYSPFSHSIQITTPSDVPSVVQDLKYKVLSPTSACVKWEPPLQKNGVLTHYTIKYAPSNSWPLDRWYKTSIYVTENVQGCWNSDSPTISAVLHNLDPNQQYMAIVVAINEAGDGNPTKPITITTKEMLVADDGEKPDNGFKSETYYKQMLGVALGFGISCLVILVCISCFLIRKRYENTHANRRLRMAAAAAANGGPYAPTTTAVRPHNSNQCRGGTDAHELQHLVEGNDLHIPQMTSNNLDTKGGNDYPLELNGGPKHKHFLNGHAGLRITENPQFFGKSHERSAGDCSGTYEEDSNSNLQLKTGHHSDVSVGASLENTRLTDLEVTLLSASQLDQEQVMTRPTATLSPNG